MNPKTEHEHDLWDKLTNTKKPIVLYGMGNGADKVLRVCESYGITVSDFFASDGFVRGQSFHGKTVLSYAAVREKYGDGNFIVLVSFATRLPEVMERIRQIAAQNELYIPDVPVFGEELFNRSFYLRHREELAEARRLFSDERSRKVYDAVIRYRLSGSLGDLEASASSPEEVTQNILHPGTYRVAADLGAYTGDTVRELLNSAPRLERVYAMEPDVHSFRKLSSYAETETRCRVIPVEACAWNREELLLFDAGGNRNSNVGNGPSAKKVRQVRALTLDSVIGEESVDYVKYDVEGSEKEALEGTAETIRRSRPELLVSLYHRSADLFSLVLLVHKLMPEAHLFLRRFPYYPAWDLNLYAAHKIRDN